MHRHARGLAGEIPQRVLDRADRRPPRLEGAALADAQHRALDQGRVLADERIAVHQHVRLEIRLEVLDLAEAVDALVGGDAHDRMAADQGAF